MSRAVNLLEISEDTLQLLRQNPATSIADHNLDCNVPLSARSIQFVEYMCCDCDGTLRGVLDSICSEVGDSGFDLSCIPNHVFWGISVVNFELQPAPDSLQPRRELARHSGFISLARTDRHELPRGGSYANRMARGMPFPCQLQVSSNPTEG